MQKFFWLLNDISMHFYWSNILYSCCFLTFDGNMNEILQDFRTKLKSLAWFYFAIRPFFNLHKNLSTVQTSLMKMNQCSFDVTIRSNFRSNLHFWFFCKKDKSGKTELVPFPVSIVFFTLFFQGQTVKVCRGLQAGLTEEFWKKMKEKKIYFRKLLSWLSKAAKALLT